jgi:hypothetical protein
MKVTCLGCKRIIEPYMKGRCRECYESSERTRDSGRKRKRPHYGRQWSKLSKATIEEHVRRCGWICPRCHKQTRDLTTDHVVPRQTSGGLAVMCRSCNSSKGARQR